MKYCPKQLFRRWLSTLIIIMVSVSARSADEYDLFRELRCPVCPSQSLLESQAPESIQLRAMVRKLVAAGHNANEIRDKLSSLYGPSIFRTPPINWGNSILWAAPYGLLCIVLSSKIHKLGQRQ